MSWTMQTGTYTNYYNLMEKIRDSFIVAGFTIEDFKVNMANAQTRGHRLNVKKGNTYIAIAGSDNGRPDNFFSGSDDWIKNSIKGICVKVSSRSLKDDNIFYGSNNIGQTTTMQCSTDNTYFIFTKGESFILCNRFTARKYGYLSFIRETGYNGHTLQYCGGSYSTFNNNIPSYTGSPYFGLPQFSFLGRHGTNSSITAGSYGFLTYDDNISNFYDNSNSNYTTISNIITQSGQGRIDTPGINNFLSYGYSSSSSIQSDNSIIRRSKSPFSDKNIPLPVELFHWFNNNTNTKKLFPLKDIFYILLNTYEAEEEFTIGNDIFIALPLLEKSATNLYTEVFCYNIGIAVKIGEVV